MTQCPYLKDCHERVGDDICIRGLHDYCKIYKRINHAELVWYDKWIKERRESLRDIELQDIGLVGRFLK